MDDHAAARPHAVVRRQADADLPGLRASTGCACPRSGTPPRPPPPRRRSRPDSTAPTRPTPAISWGALDRVVASARGASPEDHALDLHSGAHVGDHRQPPQQPLAAERVGVRRLRGGGRRSATPPTWTSTACRTSPTRAAGSSPRATAGARLPRIGTGPWSWPPIPRIKAADPGSTVLVGELAPTGTGKRGRRKPTRPLAFLRAMACVNNHSRPTRRGRCRNFQPIPADAIGHHPYQFFLRPSRPSRNRDDAAIGDGRRLLRALDRLVRARPHRSLPRTAAERLLYRVRLPDDPARPVRRHLPAAPEPLAPAGRLHRLAYTAHSRDQPVPAHRWPDPRQGRRRLPASSRAGCCSPIGARSRRTAASPIPSSSPAIAPGVRSGRAGGTP